MRRGMMPSSCWRKATGKAFERRNRQNDVGEEITSRPYRSLYDMLGIHRILSKNNEKLSQWTIQSSEEMGVAGVKYLAYI